VRAAPRSTARKPGAPRPAAHKPVPATATTLDDDLFGPSGLQHPVVWLAVAAAALMLQGGALAGWAVIVAVVSLIAAARSRRRDITAFTVLLALTLAAGVTMAALIVRANGSASPPVRVDAVVPPDPPASPAGVHPPEDPTLQPSTAPRAVDDLTPFMVPELPVSRASRAGAEMPEPVAAKDEDLADVDVQLLDRRPRLANEDDAARALAAAYSQNGGAATASDTAVVWLRVEPDGGVVYSQVLSSTSEPMNAAAGTVVNYLRYEPGMKDGVAYPTWVVQRFVIVP
jgi:hypothetical protein